VPDAEHSQTSSGLAMGSRHYMAPEQRESAKHVDATADIYTFGVLAYRIYTGTLPVGRFADSSRTSKPASTAGRFTSTFAAAISARVALAASACAGSSRTTARTRTLVSTATYLQLPGNLCRPWKRLVFDKE
jgi:serine/threonine protein kinase